MSKKPRDYLYEVEYHVIPKGSLVLGGPSHVVEVTAQSAEAAKELLLNLVPDANIGSVTRFTDIKEGD